MQNLWEMAEQQKSIRQTNTMQSKLGERADTQKEKKILALVRCVSGVFDQQQQQEQE